MRRQNLSEKSCREVENLRRICCAEAERARQLKIDELSMQRVRHGISKDPPLRRESSQCFNGSCVNRLECVGENGCKIGEVPSGRKCLKNDVR